MLKPPPLRRGDVVRFVAPAGPLNREGIERAAALLRQMGLKPTYSNDLFRTDGDYLAGDDARRAAELMEALLDPEVDAVFPGTGGYGAMRILDKLDYQAIRRRPKIVIGFSDITALHLALQKRAGLVTFHAPNPMYMLGRGGGPAPFPARWFWRALGWNPADPETPLAAPYDLAPNDPQAPFPMPTVVRGGIARGPVVGGNLSLVAALVGTPYQPETRGRILLLEDVGEAPYRVDRMLCTLKLAGLLEGISAAVIGQFSRRKSEDLEGEATTIESVLDGYFAPLGVPVVRCFPVGHVELNATIPLGVPCELNADRGTLSVLESPTEAP